MRYTFILVLFMCGAAYGAEPYRYGRDYGAITERDYAQPRYKSVFETRRGPTSGGQTFLKGGSGYIDHEGRHLHRAGAGYIDTESGAFIPSVGPSLERRPRR
jgi:hypothetical protein